MNNKCLPSFVPQRLLNTGLFGQASRARPIFILLTFLLGIWLAACQVSLPFGPSDQEIAWQAMAQTYNSLAEYILKQKGCTAEELIYVTPINVPELEAVFPDTQFFRGGARDKCMTEEYLEQGIPAHSLVAVRGGQAYPLHGVSLHDNSQANDGFQAFNRLLKDSGITVTPDNEVAIAKAAVVMMMFYDYAIFFDGKNYNVPERTIPANYRLGEPKIITIEEARELSERPPYYAYYTGKLAISVPSWTSRDGSIDLWRVAYIDGQLSYVEAECVYQNVEVVDFEARGLAQQSSTEKCQGIGAYYVDYADSGHTPPSASDINKTVVKVVVAVEPIKKGQALNPASLKVRDWPASYVPPDAISDISKTTGKVSKIDIVPGQVIQDSMFE